MDRRYFLGLTVGVIAGCAALAGSAQAVPLAPISAQQLMRTSPAGVEPAVVSQDEINRIKPEQVRWGHHHGHHHWGHHRHWGWHRHHWHHRHWGWRHHHWHHRHWHHRHW